MARVICTLENASECISGVKFSLHKDEHGAPAGMISEKITAEQAENFLEIPGYELVVEEPAPAPAKAAAAPTPAAPKAPTKAEKAAAEKAAAAEADAKAAAEKEAAEKAATEAQSSDSTPPVDNPGQKPEAEEETF